MLKIDKKKVYTLFALILLVTSTLLVGINLPAVALPTDNLIYLHGPSLVPIHMHGPRLTPIHMHSTIGLIDPFYPLYTSWHELYPAYCETWTFTSWEDNGNNYLDPSDQIDLTNDITEEVRWYHVDRVTVTMLLMHELSGELIYVEYKDEAWNPPLEPYPNPPILNPICTWWHEVWPVYHGVLGPGNPYHIGDWIDNGNGYLDVCDYIMFDPWPGEYWHVEDYATDLILNEKVMDPIYIEWHELYPAFCNYHVTTSWEEPIGDPFPGRLSPGDQVDMINQTSGITKWYYVDRVTFTMRVTNESDPTQEMYIEYKGSFETMYNIKTTVVNSTWHEVYPFYSSSMNITQWTDNCNGVLDACDHIEMYDLNIDFYYGWWHVEELSIDIILNEKIDDPTGIIWHELYPDCCVNDYETLGWEDNGNGLLNPCDNVTLALLPTGLTDEYHVENMTLTLNLTVNDITGTPPFTIGERIYIEYVDAIYYDWELMYYAKTHPLHTGWEVVCPTDRFSYPLTIEAWWDNCNGVLSYFDILKLQSLDGNISCLVDEVAVDITVKKAGQPPLEHDVAVTDVYSIFNWVYQGEIDPIVVTVVNEGDFTETVDVYAFYGGIQAAPKQTISLNAGDNQTLTFNWDTTGVPLGFYQISANATIPIDDDPSDNSLAGNTEEVRKPPKWFKKLPYPDYAPSGMPDFDEKQDLWGVGGVFTWCGPVSVANSLWWLDSEYESLYYPTPVPPPAISDHFPLVTSYNPTSWDDHDPLNLDFLVHNLAFLMDADGMRTLISHQGVNYIDMQTGISQYLQQQGVNPIGDCDGDGDVDDADIDIIEAAYGSIPGDSNWDMRADIVIDNWVNIFDLDTAAEHYGEKGMFYEHTEDFPEFPWIEEEIYRCEDVVLLLEFWVEVGPGEWTKFYEMPSFEAGHYVTCAGVNSTSFELLISDPWWDAAEAGWPGDVPVPHPPGHPTWFHNDTQFVSHDAYGVLNWTSPPLPPSPYGPSIEVWELVNYLQQLGYPPNYHTFIRAAVVTSPLESDIAVTDMIVCYGQTVIPQNRTRAVNITVTNEGPNPETFTLNVYWNDTNVINSTIVLLGIGETKTITLDWYPNQTRYAYYNISAYAAPLPSEFDTTDNKYVYGIVVVVWPGDVDGNKDVFLFDAVKMLVVYGVKFGSPGYNPNYDVDNDGRIFLYDAVILLSSYGYKEP